MPQVFAIAAYSKGFACSAGPGRVLLFEKVEEKDFYRESREIRVSKWSPEEKQETENPALRDLGACKLGWNFKVSQSGFESCGEMWPSTLPPSPNLVPHNPSIIITMILIKLPSAHIYGLHDTEMTRTSRLESRGLTPMAHVSRFIGKYSSLYTVYRGKGPESTENHHTMGGVSRKPITKGCPRGTQDVSSASQHSVALGLRNHSPSRGRGIKKAEGSIFIFFLIYHTSDVHLPWGQIPCLSAETVESAVTLFSTGTYCVRRTGTHPLLQPSVHCVPAILQAHAHTLGHICGMV